MKVELFHKFSNEEFLEVLGAVGFKTYSDDQISKALKNTMYMVKE